MDRNKEHFLGRLEKDTYSKDDVANLLQNEANFTKEKVSKGFEGMVTREDYDKLNTELNDAKAELKPFKDDHFDSLVNNEFTKLNGVKERLGDFKTLAKLQGDETPEQITAKVTELKDTNNYGFMFNAEDSGGANGGDKHKANEPVKPKKGVLTPNIGWNPFKKK